MAGILVYALHSDEGEFNNNSLGAITEAARLAGEIGGEAAALVVGDVDDAAAAGLGKYGAAKVYRAKSVPEGLAQPIVDAMAKVISENDYGYALFGGGLLGFEIGAGPDRPPRRRRDDGGDRGQGARTASSSPSARCCRTPRSSTSATSPSPP